MNKKYYVTTPIYYPNGKFHIGTAYTTILADYMKRYKTQRGFDTYMITGLDEHGQKIQDTAIANGKNPQEFVDMQAEYAKKIWELLDIDYNDLVRTTNSSHKEVVAKIFKYFLDKGDIYKGVYSGHYCKSCETYFSESELVDGRCPDCGKEVSIMEEETYFFNMKKYEKQLLKYYEEHPNFILPEFRKNELINSFFKNGIEDLSVTRTTFDWGVKVPGDEKHVIYVWLDALSNYITALGYPENKELYDKYWPANIHLVGKEIVRFHSIIWPAVLMSLDLPLPKQVLGHGWLLIDGSKMSKSSGNVVDPVILIDRYGVDALKYFLLREYTFGQDGAFTNEAMLRRMNSDLANDLGNLLSRTVAMIEKYCDGVIPPIPHICRGDVCKMGFEDDELDSELKKIALEAGHKVEAEMDKFSYSTALEQIWVLIRRANKYIDETMPWVLGKSENEEDLMRLDRVMNRLAECLRIVSILIYPFMHTSSDKMRSQLGIAGDAIIWEDAFTFDMIGGRKVEKGENLFDRFDIEKEKAALAALGDVHGANSAKKENDKGSSKDKKSSESDASTKKASDPDNEYGYKPMIEFDDFDKIDLRVGTVLEAEKHPDADKLLVFKVKVGEEIRQVISGVAQYFEPHEMIDKKVILVANLKPRKLRGLESKGMLLFADNGDRLEIVTTTAEDGNGVS